MNDMLGHGGDETQILPAALSATPHAQGVVVERGVAGSFEVSSLE